MNGKKEVGCGEFSGFQIPFKKPVLNPSFLENGHYGSHLVFAI